MLRILEFCWVFYKICMRMVNKIRWSLANRLSTSIVNLPTIIFTKYCLKRQKLENMLTGTSKFHVSSVQFLLYVRNKPIWTTKRTFLHHILRKSGLLHQFCHQPSTKNTTARTFSIEAKQNQSSYSLLNKTKELLRLLSIKVYPEM